MVKSRRMTTKKKKTSVKRSVKSSRKPSAAKKGYSSNKVKRISPSKADRANQATNKLLKSLKTKRSNR